MTDQFTDHIYTSYITSTLSSVETNHLPINTLTDKINLPIGHPESIKISQFQIVLNGLVSNTSRLDNNACNNLIIAILRYNWLDITEPLFAKAYSRFLITLVSTFPKYLHEVLNKLTHEFTSPNTSQHHQILAQIITYIPTSINSLPQFFKKNFPHHISSTTTELTNYVQNLVKVLDYSPELQFPIYQLIIEVSIKLDVELQNQLDEDEEEIEDLLDDPDLGLSKLDNIISILLNCTSPHFTIDQLNSGQGITLFNTITSLFKSHILPTHFTKLIQFILFHITQYQPELADSFLVLLIDVAFNPAETLEIRLKSIQYLSSYIARAKNLSSHQITFIVSYLVGWLNKFIIEREQEVHLGGMERFKLFYSTFQALLYIFCFRHELLITSTTTTTKFFQRAILTKFNPLKFCDETVVHIFAKLATRLNVCYCYSIIEHNKRERMLQTTGLPSAVANFKQKQEFLDLEAYFPFDPLVLPISKSIVAPNYIEWSDVNPEEDSESESDSDDTI